MKDACFERAEVAAMAKMLLSLGFWMTILLFVALGYVLSF
jgi:uncharacterized membrane protein